MGRLLEGPDDPDLSEGEHKELAVLLSQHCLASTYTSLLSSITATYPSIIAKEMPDKCSSLLIYYTGLVVAPGRPLPDIQRHQFLHTLHDGVRTFLISHPVTVERVPREEVVRLVAGLRTLLLKAVLLSAEFTPRDLAGLMAAYLPTLPLGPANSRQWRDWLDQLHLSPEQQEEPGVAALLATISKNNEAMGRYFTAQLRMLAKVRSPEHVERNTDWVMAIWATIEPKLRQVVGVVRLLVAPTHPHHHLSTHSSPKARLLATRLGAEAEEEELADFWDYVTDLRVATDFWRSGRVRELLDSS